MLPHQHARLATVQTETAAIRIEILMVDHVRGQLVLAEEEPSTDIAFVPNLSIVYRCLVAHHRVNAAEDFLA